MDFVYLTKDGLNKLKEELNELKYKKRPAISQKVATAREHGDLKENAEYHAAREELSMVETKIQYTSMISQMAIISEDDIQTDHVAILTTVTVEDQKTKKKYDYSLVSEDEADFKQNKISISSPVGKGLLGKKVDEIADISVPAGLLKYKILSIKANET